MYIIPTNIKTKDMKQEIIGAINQKEQLKEYWVDRDWETSS